MSMHEYCIIIKVLSEKKKISNITKKKNNLGNLSHMIMADAKKKGLKYPMI